MTRATYVIAEIGSNHGDGLEPMGGAIERYAALGANAIKFQWASDGAKMAANRGGGEDMAAMYRRWIEWNPKWHPILAELCRNHGVDYMCTAFLPEDVQVVAPHVAIHKVASLEALDPAMADAHGGVNTATLVSCGTMDSAEAREAKAMWRERTMGAAMLHCVSSYPAPKRAMNLALLRDGFYAGLSDHSHPAETLTGALAVAAGARYVETHVRGGGEMDAPDYDHSRTPEQFAQYVAAIRTADAMLGTGLSRTMQACETGMRTYRVDQN